MGFNLRAGPVGSVWGLAPGRVGALGKPPDALLAQPRGTSPERVRPPDGGPERVGGKVPWGPVEAEGGLG